MIFDSAVLRYLSLKPVILWPVILGHEIMGFVIFRPFFKVGTCNFWPLKYGPVIYDFRM